MKMYRAVLDGGHGVWVTGINQIEAHRVLAENRPEYVIDLHDVTELAALAAGWDEVGAFNAPAQICTLARGDDGWRWFPVAPRVQTRRVAVLLGGTAGIGAGLRSILAAELRLAELDHELQQIGPDGKTGYARAEERLAAWFTPHEEST